MLFCFCLAGLSTYAQIHDEKTLAPLKSENADLSNRLRDINIRVREIHREACEKYYFQVNNFAKRQHSEDAQTMVYLVEKLDDTVKELGKSAGVNPSDLQACKDTANTLLPH
jgi:hypothetical protein